MLNRVAFRSTRPLVRLCSSSYNSRLSVNRYSNSPSYEEEERAPTPIVEHDVDFNSSHKKKSNPEKSDRDILSRLSMAISGKDVTISKKPRSARSQLTQPDSEYNKPTEAQAESTPYQQNAYQQTDYQQYQPYSGQDQQTQTQPQSQSQSQEHQQPPQPSQPSQQQPQQPEQIYQYQNLQPQVPQPPPPPSMPPQQYMHSPSHYSPLPEPHQQPQHQLHQPQHSQQSQQSQQRFPRRPRNAQMNNNNNGGYEQAYSSPSPSPSPTPAFTGPIPAPSSSSSSSSSSSNKANSSPNSKQYATIEDIEELRSELLGKIRMLEDTIFQMKSKFRR